MLPMAAMALNFQTFSTTFFKFRFVISRLFFLAKKKVWKFNFQTFSTTLVLKIRLLILGTAVESYLPLDS